ncbi:hypothetical protein N7492_000649 [Penicillium capsulatum]|uniref:Uncharacterized protein n=1 Tax=Penicillium capsulatum TaxID=69766 RepID=A0A9W9IRN8_9EURO|nr:hypothetical protein N7492_000649 [Penicillium capsulatum]KAJ6130292.1 hypothetical protein N7512_003072 [Penicillium capsulatum]
MMLLGFRQLLLAFHFLVLFCEALHVPAGFKSYNDTSSRNALSSRDGHSNLYQQGQAFYYDGFVPDSSEVKELESLYTKVVEYLHLIDLVDASDSVFRRWFGGHGVTMVQAVFDLMQHALSPSAEDHDASNPKIWFTKTDYLNHCSKPDPPIAYTHSVQEYDQEHAKPVSNRDRMSEEDTLIVLCEGEFSKIRDLELTKCSEIEGLKTLYSEYLDLRVGTIIHELVHARSIGETAKQNTLP